MNIFKNAATKLGWPKMEPANIAASLRNTVSDDHYVAPELINAQDKSNYVALDLERLHENGFLTSLDHKSRIGEEFRVIKRPLILDALKPHDKHELNKANLIMVTSALAGEGKSFCAINLAMSIAMEMDHTVLLVDADVARPSLPKYLGLTNRRGLLDVLLDDKIKLPDVILKTNVEKLSLLLSGTKSKYSTELMASQSMKLLLTEIANSFEDRIIIFDTPPLLLTTEARELAYQMGQIVVVVEAEKTAKKQVLNALKQVESCKNVRLIYNKAQKSNDTNYYGYY